MRSATPTAWTPQSKPVWFVELGCPAVDKGANAPNLFVDAKSAESALPPYSNGGRDDLIQRRALEAYLRHWSPGVCPVSAIDGRPMIESTFLWAWDARPHPAFPARADVWADAQSWRLGHWLNGRAGLSNLGEVVRDLCLRAREEDVDVRALTGAVSGYVADAPATARDWLEPLMAAFDFTAAEREGVLCFFHRDAVASTALTLEEFSAASAASSFLTRADATSAPSEARVRFLDASRDWQVASAAARRLDGAGGGVLSLDAPLALEPAAAEALARRILDDSRSGFETATVELGPRALALTPGDRVTLDGRSGVFEVGAIEDADVRRLELRRAPAASARALASPEPAHAPLPHAPAPVFAVLDLAPLPGVETDERPLAALFAAPWTGAHAVYGGDGRSLRGTAEQPSIMGELVWDLWPGPVDRWDEGNVTRIKLYNGALSSASRFDVLDGANVFAIEADGEWEIVQAARCTLTGPGEYEMADLLRGRLGSDHAMRSPHRAGARIVKLDRRLARLEIAAHEWGEALALAAPPASAPAADARAVVVSLALSRAAARAWAPAHLRAQRTPDGGVRLTWIRCARSGGDGWGAGEPPAESPESYQVDILSGETIKRTAIVPAPEYAYTAAAQVSDFGGPAASFRLRVAQIDRFGRPGLKRELTITL